MDATLQWECYDFHDVPCLSSCVVHVCVTYKVLYRSESDVLPIAFVFLLHRYPGLELHCACPTYYFSHPTAQRTAVTMRFLLPTFLSLLLPTFTLAIYAGELVVAQVYQIIPDHPKNRLIIGWSSSNGAKEMLDPSKVRSREAPPLIGHPPTR